MKRCSRCQTEKPLDSFAIDRKAKDGHSSRCRACLVIATKEREQRRAIELNDPHWKSKDQRERREWPRQEAARLAARNARIAEKRRATIAENKRIAAQLAALRKAIAC